MGKKRSRKRSTTTAITARAAPPSVVYTTRKKRKKKKRLLDPQPYHRQKVTNQLPMRTRNGSNALVLRERNSFEKKRQSINWMNKKSSVLPSVLPYQLSL